MGTVQLLLVFVFIEQGGFLRGLFEQSQSLTKEVIDSQQIFLDHDDVALMLLVVVQVDELPLHILLHFLQPLDFHAFWLVPRR